MNVLKENEGSWVPTYADGNCFPMISAAMFRKPQAGTRPGPLSVLCQCKPLTLRGTHVSAQNITGTWTAIQNMVCHGAPVYKKYSDGKFDSSADSQWATTESGSYMGYSYLVYLDSRQTNVIGLYNKSTQSFDGMNNGLGEVKPDGWFLFNAYGIDLANVEASGSGSGSGSGSTVTNTDIYRTLLDIVGRRPVLRGRVGKGSRSPSDVELFKNGAGKWQIYSQNSMSYVEISSGLYFTDNDQLAQNFHNYYGPKAGNSEGKKIGTDTKSANGQKKIQKMNSQIGTANQRNRIEMRSITNEANGK
jgi:hypothetical protein